MKQGDTVRMNPEAMKHIKKLGLTTEHETATIKAVLKDIRGGIYLNRPLYGFQYWNELDLELVEETENV